LALPIGVDPHSLQLSGSRAIGSQRSHGDDPSIDVIDKEVTASTNVARINVVKVAVECFGIRALD
jgi:hypothetical protein